MFFVFSNVLHTQNSWIDFSHFTFMIWILLYLFIMLFNQFNICILIKLQHSTYLYQKITNTFSVANLKIYIYSNGFRGRVFWLKDQSNTLNDPNNQLCVIIGQFNLLFYYYFKICIVFKVLISFLAGVFNWESYFFIYSS